MNKPNKKPDSVLYKIEGTEDQIALISHACEVLARIRIGQINAVINELPLVDDTDNYALLLKLESELHPITKTHIPIDESFILHQTIRHRLSWDRFPEGGMTVNFDEPLVINDKPFIKVERIEKKLITHSVFDNKPSNILSAHIDENGWLFINECTIDQLLVLDGQHICQVEGKWSYPVSGGYNNDSWKGSAINRNG